MTDFQTRLAAEIEGAETDESDAGETNRDRPADPDRDPFSMGYDTDSYALNAETTDRMLTLLVAVTNLL